MARIRGRKRERRQARIGAPDAALTANGGMAAISELCERLRVIEAIDAAAGPIKQRDRGYGAGQLLAGIAAAQLAGEDFLAGLDRQRADVAGQQLTPVPGLSSTTAAGLARRIRPEQWQAVERGVAAVTAADAGAAAARAGRCAGAGRSPSTWMPPMWRFTAGRSGAWPITTRASGQAGRTWPPGRKPRSCWPLTWAPASMIPARARRACCAGRWPACRSGPGTGAG